MTERSFRLVIGIWLVVALLIAQPIASYVLIGVLLFEGITNWRVPMLMARFAGDRGAVAAPVSEQSASSIPFEAERALRLIIVAFLGMSMFLVPELLWWLPWFIAFALVGAGMSGICPMVLALRWVGMR
jgi:archaellum biogenesis protein FlaJ (TadC family)